MNTEKSYNFTSINQDDEQVSLSDFEDQYVLVYFYPKDDTPGCTVEACTIRDNYSAFAERNIQVIGVSADSPGSHRKFIAKYHLPFMLISDQDGEVAAKFSAGSPPFFRRVSFLFAPGGKLIKEYPKVDPANHAAEIIADIDSM